VGRASDAEAILADFFQKIKHTLAYFKHILAYISALNAFLNNFKKCAAAPPKACASELMLLLAPLATPLCQ